MSGLLDIDNEMESMECDDALDDFGYVLELTTAGNVAKCNTNVLVPFGIAWSDTDVYTWSSTTKESSWTATASKMVAVQKKGHSKVQLYTDGASAYRSQAITIRDILIASDRTEGVCDHNQGNSSTNLNADNVPAAGELRYIVGIAREAVLTTAEDGTVGGTKKIWTQLKLQGGTL
jgi:hypothetical protein